MIRDSVVKSVLLIGGRRTEALEAAREAGCRVIFAGPKSAMTERHRELADAVFLLPDLAPGTAVELALAVHPVVPFDLALTVGDQYSLAAARINHELGLGSNPLRTVSAVNDKALMREILRDKAVSQVSAAEVRTPADLQEFVASTGFPVIVKPALGSASKDVFVVADRAALESTMPRLGLADGDSTPWVVEEFLQGREFSVETHSTAGVHHLLAVTEKFTTENFVEIGHVVPARISAEERDAIADEVRAVLTALGVEEGPGHTEIMLTARGPRLIETHTRPGGDAIVELLRLATGHDIHRLNFAWLSGQPVDMAAKPLVGAAAIWFLTLPQGRVTAAGGLAEADAVEGVMAADLSAAVGDVIAPIRSSEDRYGEALAVGDDADSALHRAREGVARLTVEVEPPQPAAPAAR
ncbi:ATP-grasp domain-containing protein [Kitasatospora sp. KL5]|uniref:ATP-grasp domain-containing protein n=1 Tax=Kitasatospora sp. KL5 TaxID=3425125 RepID=UPI003D6EDD6A